MAQNFFQLLIRGSCKTPIWGQIRPFSAGSLLRKLPTLNRVCQFAKKRACGKIIEFGLQSDFCNCLVLIVFCSMLYGKQLDVEVAAPRAVLINAETGAVLYEKKKDELAFPASVTKIATLLYILEKKPERLKELATASKAAMTMMPAPIKKSKNFAIPPYYLEPDGTHMGIRQGETLPLETLAAGLMVSSANEAANIMAEYLSGSIPAFVEELNHFIKSLGCQKTHFLNPHGLYHPQHYTTAFDLAIIMREAIKNPQFCTLASNLQFTRVKTQFSPETILYRRNKLLKPGKYFYPRVFAAKSGYVFHAGFNLVSAAREGDRVLIAVVLGGSNNDERYADTVKLFDAAFNERRVSHRLFDARENLFTFPVKGAKTVLRATLRDDFAIEYYPAEEPVFKPELHWNDFQLPIHAGEIVGEIRLINDQGVLKSASLYAIEDVHKTFWSACSDQRRLFSRAGLKKRWVLLIFSLSVIGCTILFQRKIKVKKRL